MSHNDLESEFTSPPLLVTTLDVHVKPQSRKKTEKITVNAGNTTTQICQAISPGSHHHEVFNPPLEVLLSADFSVSVHYNGTLRNVVSISLDPKTIFREATDEDGKQVYSKTESNIEITIGIQPLPSTVKEIVASCSKFRLLIIGKSGVGKSSLINRTFGVSDVHVDDATRGQASIEQEYITRDNNRFVVHDTCGFEAAERTNSDNVCDFIKRRRRMKDLKDQLHAVWLCLEIPFAGGRLLETGAEDFLRKRDQILGNIPLVVVFTKLDSLGDMLRADALRKGESLDDDALKRRVQEVLEERCFAPLRTTIGNGSVPHLAVSSQEGYEGSLTKLVQETTKSIRTHIKHEAVHYIAAIAQRVDISLKVAATIGIGEKIYRKMFVGSWNPLGHSVKECLDVLHKDIVTIWNFKDPHGSLCGDDFRGRLLKAPDSKAKYHRQTAEAVVSAIVDGLARTTPLPSAPVQLPRDLCNKAISKNNIQRFMAYTVDLTCVMQALFILITVRYHEASTEALGIAIQVHEEVHRFAVHTDINKLSGRDCKMLDKLKELIWKYHVPDEYLAELRLQL